MHNSQESITMRLNAPVAKFNSIRVLLSIGALLDLEIHQMDVKSAFLNGKLDEELYMEVPEGLDIDGNDDKICRLFRSFYGLKQASRMWYQRMDEFLVNKEGFQRLDADFGIYRRRTNTSLVIIALYVDDIIILADSIETMTIVKKTLSEEFEMTDCGELHYFLGIQVQRDRPSRTITLSQEHYVKQILRRFGMYDAKPVATPLDASTKLTAQAADDKATDSTLFRQIIGSLMYLMIGIRPDLAAAVSITSQFAANPTEKHLSAAKRILRYLKGTSGHALHLGLQTPGDQEPSPPHLHLYGYSDANCGNDIDSRKSTSGYIFFISGGPISWSSKKQSTIALSSTEAEYMALTHASKEAIWLRRFLRELDFEFQEQEPTLIFEDNQSAIALAKNPVHHARSKHIDIQYHFIRDKVETGEIELRYTPTTEMIADAMTKPLARPQFEQLVRKMWVLG